MTSLLERKDRMSMAKGVEIRVPFADHRLWEYVFNIPWEIKFENNVEKSLLREVMKEYLPDSILHRKKSPYPKTHNPEYMKIVSNMLDDRIKKGGILSQILNKKKLSEIKEKSGGTWLGQLMSTPQLIAWLVQFDYWFEKKGIILKV
jgi:asparagine synthase (glutamine-hydrolysing)